MSEPSDNPIEQPPIVLDYGPPERRRRISTTAVFDVICAFLSFGFLVGFLVACQINLEEAPIHGGGSGYNDKAPCNEQWQLNHPVFSQLILMIPLPEWLVVVPLLPVMLVQLFSGMTAPYWLAAWLGVVVYRRRKQRRWRMLLGVILLLLLATFPWIYQSFIVLFD